MPKDEQAEFGEYYFGPDFGLLTEKRYDEASTALANATASLSKLNLTYNQIELDRTVPREHYNRDYTGKYLPEGTTPPLSANELASLKEGLSDTLRSIEDVSSKMDALGIDTSQSMAPSQNKKSWLERLLPSSTNDVVASFSK